ncbi:MAG: class I SAM-dependent methyltransferase, partial [Thermomicrobiales bacterium]|nr:class I SAM-dependent methyltransferase [Thermomicrobiales bacterium]
FGFLEGRATEERPPWGYARLMAERLGRVGSALDLDTGGGEVLAEAPVFPARMAAAESWPPNAERAQQLLGARGVEVILTDPEAPLPFPDGSFELVTSRHPIRPDWPEIHRVLAPGGRYLGQHVGPASAYELIEYFLGPLSRENLGRDPEVESNEARTAGLVISDLRTARCRMEFFDIGAVVWILRKCVWWVPDFSVEKYEAKLRDLDAQLRTGEPFIAHSTRHLIEAERAAISH